MTKNQLNVLGEKLELCSLDPITGWYRDGCCNTDENDFGTHTVCARVNDDFLKFCKEHGNDLITPRPEYNFEGLKDGDCWVCVQLGSKELSMQDIHVKFLLKALIKKL